MYTNGFGYIWENQNLGANKEFFNIFKTRLLDSFWQSNNAEIDSLSVHRLYRHLSYVSNNYLFSLPNNYIRISLTRLRLGSHHLNVERGRWNKIDYADRKCNLCNDIEDEFHFVVCCPKYIDLRKKYLPKQLYLNPRMHKFILFLNSNDILQMKKLGIFLHHALKKYGSEEIL